MRKRISILLFSLAVASVQAQQLVTTYEGPFGHTVAMDVASFTDVRDKTLEDVLAKMPGVEIGTNSTTYNQMTISKIYINGSDSRSSMKLISGIKPEEIEKVEFVENFQSVEVLRGRQYSAAVLMNIVLKETSNSAWSGSMRGGIGFSKFLYDADLYAIRMGKKSTNMVNVKANDTGEDLSSSISSFQADNIGLNINYFTLDNYISIDPTTSSLSTSRTRFNHDLMINSVNTHSLSDKFQLYGQLSYLRSDVDTEMKTDVTHFMEDGTSQTVTTDEMANNMTNQAKTNLVLISNNDKYYLANHIYANASWRDVSMNLTGTYPNDQSGNLTSITAKDDFRFLKPLGNWNLTVFSQNQYSAIPQEIHVKRAISTQDQDIRSHALFSDSQVSLGYTAGKWTTSLVGGFDIMTRNMASDLTGVEFANQSDFQTMDNDSRFTYIQAFAKPTVNYVDGRFQMQLGVPIRYYNYHFKEQMRDEKSDKSTTNLEPAFSVKYKLSDYLSLRLEGSVTYAQVAAGNFYTGHILTNYRYIKQGALNYNLDSTKKLELGYDYKWPKQSLFVGGQVGYQNIETQYMTSDAFIGDYVIRGTMGQVATTKYKYGHVSAQKGISALKGFVGLWMGVTDRDMEMVRNNTHVDYNTKALVIQPSVNGRLTSWLKVQYNMSFTTSTMTMLDTKTNSLTYNQGVELMFNPTRKFNISMFGEHYHTSNTNLDGVNLLLLDAKAEYQLTPRLQAIVSVKNLLDKSEYTYSTISTSDLSTTQVAYKLRPRNVLFSLYYKF